MSRVGHEPTAPEPVRSVDPELRLRARRLWGCVALAVAGVYSTLLTASVLSDVLYHEGLVTVLFLGAMALMGLAVLTQGLRVRPRGLEIGVALGIFAVYMMIFLRLAIPERSHLIEYGVVSVLLHEALHASAAAGRTIPVPAASAIVLTTVVGAIDETIQLALPFRHFDWTDMLFNLIAAVMGVGSVVALRWVTRRGRKRPATP